MLVVTDAGFGLLEADAVVAVVGRVVTDPAIGIPAHSFEIIHKQFLTFGSFGEEPSDSGSHTHGFLQGGEEDSQILLSGTTKDKGVLEAPLSFVVPYFNES